MITRSEAAAEARRRFTDKALDLFTDPMLTTPALVRSLAEAADEYAAAMVELHARPNVVVRDGRVRLEAAQ